MDLEPHHIGIVVSDIRRSMEFYAALGFETVQENDDGAKTITFMRLGRLMVELFCYRETPTEAAKGTGRRLGFRHLALRTGDIDAVLAELRAGGLVAERAAIRDMPGGWRLLFFDDPDGVEIEVMQERTARSPGR
jgi:glyoxylase I family protein